MTKLSKYQPGQFSWIDLMSPDAAAAKSFYQALFGWDATDNPTDQGGVYTQFTCEGQMVAGLGQMGEEMKSARVPATWNSYVSVQDVEACAARAAELGGSVVMPPMQVMDAGKMAIISDPTGAALSLWQAGQHVGAGLVNEPTSLCWNELATNDTERAAAFYRELFSWSLSDADGSGYLMIENQGQMNGGIRALGDEQANLPPHWMAYVAVEDCDACCARSTDLGAGVIVPPMDIPPGRFAVIADPQGAVLTVMKLNQPD